MAQKFTSLMKNIRLLCKFMVRSFNNVQTSLLCHYLSAAALILIQKGIGGKASLQVTVPKPGMWKYDPNNKKMAFLIIVI